MSHCCLLLDRPGCGLSEPVDYRAMEVRMLAADVLESVMDALEIDHFRRRQPMS